MQIMYSQRDNTSHLQHKTTPAVSVSTEMLHKSGISAPKKNMSLLALTSQNG